MSHNRIIEARKSLKQNSNNSSELTSIILDINNLIKKRKTEKKSNFELAKLNHYLLRLQYHIKKYAKDSFYNTSIQKFIDYLNILKTELELNTRGISRNSPQIANSIMRGQVKASSIFNQNQSPRTPIRQLPVTPVRKILVRGANQGNSETNTQHSRSETHFTNMVNVVAPPQQLETALKTGSLAMCGDCGPKCCTISGGSKKRKTRKNRKQRK